MSMLSREKFRSAGIGAVMLASVFLPVHLLRKNRNRKARSVSNLPYV